VHLHHPQHIPVPDPGGIEADPELEQRHGFRDDVVGGQERDAAFQQWLSGTPLTY
jgi:hypothetical protein